MQENRLVTNTSATMTKSQKDKYAQFEKECLVIVNAICRRNKWLYGHHSIIMETYHKPFQTLFKHRITEASKHLHEMLLKLQRYALIHQQQVQSMFFFWGGGHFLLHNIHLFNYLLIS